MPSVVSTRVMPAANSTGNTSTDQIETPFAASAAETPSRLTSVAVSKPSPNRKPTGSMCQLRETSRNTGRNSRASTPRPSSSKSRSSGSYGLPSLTWRKARHTPRRMTMFIAAIRNRNRAEAEVETMPPIPLQASKRVCSAAAVAATAAATSRTTVECPMAKKKPTETGRPPSCISLRVTLSIAAIWSASTAWRRPNPQASSPVLSSSGWAWKARNAQAQATRLKASSRQYIPAMRGLNLPDGPGLCVADMERNPRQTSCARAAKPGLRTGRARLDTPPGATALTSGPGRMPRP